MATSQALYNWRVPIFPDSCTYFAVADKQQYPNIIRVNTPLTRVGKSAAAVMKVDAAQCMLCPRRCKQGAMGYPNDCFVYRI